MPIRPVRRTVVAVPLLALATLCLLQLAACVPLAITAVGGSAMVATDRRSTGSQVDDEIIEDKLAASMQERYKNEAHINITSYNGHVLLTGEAPTATAKSDVAEMARTTPKVKGVQDDLVVGPVADLSSRTNDTFITTKVKTRFIEASKFQINHVKVVTERGVVYLMGLVRHDEGDAAAEIARTTSGAQRVVKLFEYIN
jgi:osmotically-inducible protein OsmY